MRVKHFAGYGTIDMKKVKDKSCTLHVFVKGNHECGLVRNDLYDLYNWIVKRYDKNVPDWLEWERNLKNYSIVPGWDGDVETCTYKFDY